MKAALEIWRDAAVIRIMDDTGRVIDRYETDGIDIDNHQYEKRHEDPEGTLPIVPKTMN
jgi:glutamine cyclotransferase